MIAKEAKQLYDRTEINGDDLHRILLAIANLFEYLNQRYGDNEVLYEEVVKMTKTLYDPVVEEKGIEKGIEKGEMKKAIETAKAAIGKGLSKEIIADITGLNIKKIEELEKEIKH